MIVQEGCEHGPGVLMLSMLEVSSVGVRKLLGLRDFRLIGRLGGRHDLAGAASCGLYRRWEGHLQAPL